MCVWLMDMANVAQRPRVLDFAWQLNGCVRLVHMRGRPVGMLVRYVVLHEPPPGYGRARKSVLCASK